MVIFLTKGKVQVQVMLLSMRELSRLQINPGSRCKTFIAALNGYVEFVSLDTTTYKYGILFQERSVMQKCIN